MPTLSGNSSFITVPPGGGTDIPGYLTRPSEATQVSNVTSMNNSTGLCASGTPAILWSDTAGWNTFGVLHNTDGADLTAQDVFAADAAPPSDSQATISCVDLDATRTAEYAGLAADNGIATLKPAMHQKRNIRDGITIIASTLLPNRNVVTQAAIAQLNSQIPGVVKTRQQAGRKITYVDFSSSYLSLADIGSDGHILLRLGTKKWPKHGIVSNEFDLRSDLEVVGLIYHAEGIYIANSQNWITGMIKHTEGKERVIVDGDGRDDLLNVNMLNGSTTMWSNGGQVLSSGSAFQWKWKGVVSPGGSCRGSCIEFGALYGLGRADYIIVDPSTNKAWTWVNVCPDGSGLVTPSLPSGAPAAPGPASPSSPSSGATTITTQGSGSGSGSRSDAGPSGGSGYVTIDPAL
nr:hypothetical protein B0A51_03074 [Rachicladosporium sp. CCFEE 5018]